ncbi:hypothetical protein HK098_004600 [Nowakowskiella sp. JEL0407]|nr:hypothetical protein HK098_004600 [Nowakowskiella sp. JEL0407]
MFFRIRSIIPRSQPLFRPNLSILRFPALFIRFTRSKTHSSSSPSSLKPTTNVGSKASVSETDSEVILSSILDAPGWNEALASTSEAVIKAERASTAQAPDELLVYTSVKVLAAEGLIPDDATKKVEHDTSDDIKDAMHADWEKGEEAVKKSKE